MNVEGDFPHRTTARTALRVLALIMIPLVLVLVLPVRRLRTHSLHLTSCLQTANDLREGASVRISGVEVGLVRKVRVQPQEHACPVMVEMELQTDYELRVPRDSKAYTSTEGILGAGYVGIDSAEASGSPIENWGRLPSKVVPEITSADFLRELTSALQRSEDKAPKGQTSSVPSR